MKVSCSYIRAYSAVTNIIKLLLATRARDRHAFGIPRRKQNNLSNFSCWSMVDKSASSTPSSSTTPAARSGVHAALRYTGLPESWITRPRLPSRNWLIFIGAVSSLVSAYAYDRRQCRLIREEYIRKVEHLAQEPMPSSALPRKVTVYAAKWPGDEDHSRPLRYFRKYVKVRPPSIVHFL